MPSARRPRDCHELATTRPVVATLFAAVLIFLVVAGLGMIELSNTLTKLQQPDVGQSDSSPLGTGICGLLSLVLLGSAIYFLFAILKGVRDLSTPLYFTRGTVIKKPNTRPRRVDSWLLLETSYIGSDAAQASDVTDEQSAVSVDRSQIVQPRFAPKKGASSSQGTSGLESELRATSGEQSSSSYLRPERISAEQERLRSAETQALPPRSVFRVDFASKLGFQPGEEVLVAHSRYLQHIYYIARLRAGEWEITQNKRLI